MFFFCEFLASPLGIAYCISSQPTFLIDTPNSDDEVNLTRPPCCFGSLIPDFREFHSIPALPSKAQNVKQKTRPERKLLKRNQKEMDPSCFAHSQNRTDDLVITSDTLYH
jgi:hypothetical protein